MKPSPKRKRLGCRRQLVLNDSGGRETEPKVACKLWDSGAKRRLPLTRVNAVAGVILVGCSRHRLAASAHDGNVQWHIAMQRHGDYSRCVHAGGCHSVREWIHQVSWRRLPFPRALRRCLELLRFVYRKAHVPVRPRAPARL